MADLNKVPENIPQQPPPENKETKPDADKFKEMMRVKDPDEQKNKGNKQRQESTEDMKAELSAPLANSLSKTTKKNPIKVASIKKTTHGPSKPVKPSAHIQAPQASTFEHKTSPTEKIVSSQTPLTHSAEPPKHHLPMNQTKEVIVKEEIRKKQKSEQTTKQQNKMDYQKKKHEPSQNELYPLLNSNLTSNFLTGSTETPPAYTLLNSQALMIFEKMVSVMQVMNDSGITETTIHLNTPQFSSSIFSGAEIILREFSTAPLIYNIEFVGNPQAVALLQKNMETLMHSFQEGKYRFKVNRIDTRLEDRQSSPFKKKQEENDSLE